MVAARGSKGSYQGPASGDIVGGSTKAETAEQHSSINREKQSKGVRETGDLHVAGGYHGSNNLAAEL